MYIFTQKRKTCNDNVKIIYYVPTYIYLGINKSVATTPSLKSPIVFKEVDQDF